MQVILHLATEVRSVTRICMMGLEFEMDKYEKGDSRASIKRRDTFSDSCVKLVMSIYRGILVLAQRN